MAGFDSVVHPVSIGRHHLSMLGRTVSPLPAATTRTSMDSEVIDLPAGPNDPVGTIFAAAEASAINICAHDGSNVTTGELDRTEGREPWQ